MSVFPNARIIHLVRNGKDVVDSVYRQWGETRGLSYFISKIKTYPLKHGLSYLASYVRDWIRFKFLRKGGEAYIWGVKYPGYEEDAKHYSILERIALQWKICINNASDYIDSIEKERVHFLRYEDLVANPSVELSKVVHFLNLTSDEFPGYSNLHSENVGKGNAIFEGDEANNAKRIIEPVLSKLNYV